jgi:hypothetical protein
MLLMRLPVNWGDAQVETDSPTSFLQALQAAVSIDGKASHRLTFTFLTRCSLYLFVVVRGR